MTPRRAAMEKLTYKLSQRKTGKGHKTKPGEAEA